MHSVQEAEPRPVAATHRAEPQLIERLKTASKRAVAAVAITAVGLTTLASSSPEGFDAANTYSTAVHANYPGTPPAFPQSLRQPEDLQSATPETIPKHPNVILVLLDDMQMQLLPYMHKTNKLIFEQGATANNYFDNMTLCCPARATLLRGQYAHNTGVKSNTTPNGGFEKFHKSGDEKSTIATWINDLKNGGGHSIYDTALMGKYMNNFPYNFGKGKHNQHYVPDEFVPPGWTYFASPVKGNPYTQDHYKLAINGHVDKHFRNMSQNPDNYMPDTLGRMAVSYINDHKNKPYFLYWATYAPHSPSTYAPRYKNYPVNGLRPEDDPSFNEKNMSDKPEFMQKLSPINANVKEQIDTNFNDRVKAVQAVDDDVAKMINALKKTGEYDNTYVIFTSDNGFHEGQHRLAMGKNTPYNTDIHLPFGIIGPGIKPGMQINQTVGDVDIAQTVAALTGAKPTDNPDGESMMPLFYGDDKKWHPQIIETERFNSQAYSVTNDGLNEPADTPSQEGRTSTTPFKGVRTARYLFVIYGYKPGQDNLHKPTEFYDERADPYELHNLASEKHLSPYYKAVEYRLRHDLAKLAVCKGSGCLYPNK